MKKDQFDIIGAGHGFWNYFGNLAFTELGDNNFIPGAVLPELLSKTMAHSIMEHHGTMNLDLMYGGWFEIAQIIDDEFSKLPYAIVFWDKHGDFVYPYAIFFCWYLGNRLCITRVVETRAAHLISKDETTFIIEDFFGREGDPGAHLPAYPAFVFHARTGDAPPIQTYLEPYASNGEMSILMGKDGVLRINISRKLKRRIRDLESNPFKDASPKGFLESTW